ncbi:hypothetical protein EJ04DRAFT_29193 [Polyplosphaeria fusca]|uniref:Uncharacterized protein n=1 Tax=Polyplosphaeria fusca TaxID=682080 RepID=A0A9P4QR06_9PLEO|nr:hypothetical protein EJ04DRAFT_29193 [Polyplosphaeria fusca]
MSQSGGFWTWGETRERASTRGFGSIVEKRRRAKREGFYIHSSYLFLLFQREKPRIPIVTLAPRCHKLNSNRASKHIIPAPLSMVD